MRFPTGAGAGGCVSRFINGDAAGSIVLTALAYGLLASGSSADFKYFYVFPAHRLGSRPACIAWRGVRRDADQPGHSGLVARRRR